MAWWAREMKWSFIFKLAALAGLILPIVAAAILSFVPSKKYEGVVWMILDASRGSQTVAGIDDRRGGNEVVTYDQLLRTQLTIAGSDDVVRKAIESMRPQRLYPELPAPEGGEAALVLRDTAIARANMGLSLEPNTFVFKISFRHRDPVIAARFANALAAEFQSRRSALYSNEGDVDFFKAQEKRFVEDLRTSSKALEEFGQRFSIYSVSSQRTLLLERRSIAAKEQADNATQIARLDSELNSLRQQMLALRSRMTLPPEIFGDARSPAVRPGRAGDMLSNDPPLLNVNIYKDSAARLVAANAELEGLKATQGHRIEVVKQIDADLQSLSANEAAYNSLSRAVAQAEAAIDNLTKRAGEARVNNAWRSNEAFSTAQILQAASPSVSPVSPRPAIFMPAGIIAGLFCSLLTLFVGHRLGLVSLGFVGRLVPRALIEDQAPVGRVPLEQVQTIRPARFR